MAWNAGASRSRQWVLPEYATELPRVRGGLRLGGRGEGSNMGYLTDPDGYRRGLKEVALIGLRRDLGRAGASETAIAAAERELRAALVEVTVEEFPDPADY